MRELEYAGGSFHLSDRVAAALLEYARALAEHATADTVRLSAYDTKGELVDLDILLGPASQILTRDVDAQLPDPPDDEMVLEELSRRTERLRPSRPVPEPLEDDDRSMP